jgi:ketosteroid isomerase-like protein
MVVLGGTITYAEVALPKEEVLIKAQLTAYAAARQRGDGREQSLFYTEDAETWLSLTRRLSRGRAEIAKELNVPADPNRRLRFEFENVSFLSPTVAFVDLQYYGLSPEPSGHAFYVMVKRDGRWLIREGRIMRFAPPSQ